MFLLPGIAAGSAPREASLLLPCAVGQARQPRGPWQGSSECSTPEVIL